MIQFMPNIRFGTQRKAEPTLTQKLSLKNSLQTQTTSDVFFKTPINKLTFGNTTEAPLGFAKPLGSEVLRTLKGETYSQHEVTYKDDKDHTGHIQFIRFNQLAHPSQINNPIGAKAAELVRIDILRSLLATPSKRPLIITPTGNTPIPFYKAWREQTDMPWNKVILGHLDEYVYKPKLGLPKEASYQDFMTYHLWDHLKEKGFSPETWAIMDEIENPKMRNARRKYLTAIQLYEEKIQNKGGPQTVVLGLGPNGHIAFIEPPTGKELTYMNRLPSDDARRNYFFQKYGPAHWTPLSEETLQANFGSPEDRRRYGYSDEAVTLGFDTIMSAKHIIVLANENKSDAVKQAFGDFTVPPTPDCPASYLKWHNNVTVITDF